MAENISKSLKIREKICMVTTSFLDYDTRILKEAETLAKYYDLTILTKKYDRPIILKKSNFKIKRIKYFKFGIFLLNILSSFFSLTLAAFKENPDIYHAHDLDGLLCAYLPSLIKRRKLIYDSHELWSGLPNFSNLKGVRWLIPLLEKLLMTKVYQGITVNESIAEILEKKYNKPFLPIYNFSNIPKGKKQFSLKKKYPNQKIILHLGKTSELRGQAQIDLATKFLPDHFKTVFIKDIPPDDIVATINEADIGLALTQKSSLSYYYSLPNKLFQYIAAEVPVLGSNFPEIKKVILENQIGEVVDPSNPKLIAQKILEMMKSENQKKYRRNLKGLARKKYNWDEESKKLLLFYEDLIGNGK